MATQVRRSGNVLRLYDKTEVLLGRVVVNYIRHKDRPDEIPLVVVYDGKCFMHPSDKRFEPYEYMEVTSELVTEKYRG